MIVEKFLLNKVDDVKGFVIEAGKQDFDINVRQNSYVVDGKSLMGVFSLDNSKPVSVEFMTDDRVAVRGFDQYGLQQ